MSSYHQCRAKYLGKVVASAPKIGTLENAARVYQRGCLNINDREMLKIIVNPKAISLENQDRMLYRFSIKSTLFCATYKKIPQVVAFNYLSTKDPPTIECHALYMNSPLEAQNFVQAITEAFGCAYRSRCNVDVDTTEITDSNANQKMTISIKNYASNKEPINKNYPWVEKLNEVFRIFNRKRVR